MQETSSNLHSLVTKKVKKGDFSKSSQEDPDYEGVYLCVRAYGSSPAAFALRATATRCPSDFDASGNQLVCQTRADAPEAERRYSECSDAGQCICTGQYAKPVPEVYDGELRSSTARSMSCSPCIGKDATAQLPVFLQGWGLKTAQRQLFRSTAAS